MLCLLEQMPDGRGWCPDCDPEKKRLLPNHALRRNCRRPKPFRERLGQTLRDKIDRDETCRTWEEVQETLDKCFGDCEHFDGRLCQVGVVHDCKRLEVWITTLLTGPCKRYRQRGGS